MNRRLSPLLFAVAGCCALLVAACAPRAQLENAVSSESPKPLQAIWSGTSDGYQIAWSTKEITAKLKHPSAGRPIAFSDMGLTVLDFSRIGDMQSGNCDFSRASSLLSVVGSYLSIRHDDQMRCGNTNAPARRTQVVAIDLRAPQRRPMLSDVFGSAAVYGGLLHATPVLATLSAAHAPHPRDLPQLLKQLRASGPVCDAGFPADLLGRFSFADVRAGTVLVRLSLPLDCRTADIGLWLTIPSALQRPLQLAATRKEGFLSDAEPGIAKGRATTILYHVRNNTTQ